jgi:hypothetical protein
MDSIRAARLARIVEASGSIAAAVDPATRRIGRLRRIQNAWLHQLTPRSIAAAQDQLTRRRPPG